MASKKKIREQITLCNKNKAILLAHKDQYEKDYFDAKLKEYDDYLVRKQLEMAAIDRKRTYLHGGSFLVIVIVAFFFIRPAYIGFVAFDNASNLSSDLNQSDINFTSSDSAAPPQSPSFNLTNTSLNLTNITVSSPTSNGSSAAPPQTPIIFFNESINLTDPGSAAPPQYPDSSNLTNASINLTDPGSAAPPQYLDLSNLTNMTNETLNLTGNVSLNLTNVTEPANITVNLTENLTEPANITIPVNLTENVTKPENLTEPVNVSEEIEPVENITVLVNLAPRGALPPQFMEPNMAIAINLSEYFGDPENDSMWYSVDEHANFDVSVDDDVLTIVSNDVGQYVIIVFVTDRVNNIAAAMDVKVDGLVEVAPAGMLAQRLNVTISKFLSEEGYYNIDMVKGRNQIKFNRLQDINDLKNISFDKPVRGLYKGKQIDFGSDVVQINSLALESAEITLEKTGPVNAIMKCDDDCTEWYPTNIPFSDNGSHIIFTVDSFSGYGGAYITIIDLQSYPTVGGNWTVRFNTTGVANLTISAANGTTFGTGVPDDLEWLVLKCGLADVNASFNGSHVFYEDWNCSDLGYHTVHVLTPGSHYQNFVFGDDIGFAQNWAKSGTVYNCSSCSDCTSAIDDASPGDTIMMNASIIGDDSSCISFDSDDNNITFDCNGFTINGDEDSDGDGIGIGGDNNTIQNCDNISGFNMNIRVNSNYNTLRNLTFYQANAQDIRIGSWDSYNTITNISMLDGTITFSSGGIYMDDYGTNNVIRNVIARDLTNNALYIFNTSNNIFEDFDIVDCDGGFDIYGTISEHNIFNNFRIINGTGTGLYMQDGNLNNFSNFEIINAERDGAHIRADCNNNTFKNFTIRGSNEDGIELRGDYNKFVNVTSIHNNLSGVKYYYSDYSTFIDCNISYNRIYGFDLSGFSQGHNISGTYITNNNDSGIFLDGDTWQPFDNLFYNNYLDNNGTYGNIRLSSNHNKTNYFNTSLDCTMTNIIGGNYIGGNYWTNSTGDGYSDTCTDLVTPYGICDDYYNLSNGTSTAIDWLPLSNKACYDCASCNARIQEASDGDTIYLTSNISNHVGSCIWFNGKDNITFDCLGHYIDGDASVGDGGINLNDSNGGSQDVTVRNCNVTEFEQNIDIYTSSQRIFLLNITADGTHANNDHSIRILGEDHYLENITAPADVNGIQMLVTGSILTDFFVSGVSYALEVQSGGDNNITNGTITSYGAWSSIIFSSGTDRNRFENITIYNTQQAININGDSDNNTFTRMNISSSGVGLRMLTSANGNIFYDNYINASQYLDIADGGGVNYLNTSLFATTNFIGGNYIGGNYWTNSTGDGYSDTCTDNVAPFGICDVEYNLSNGTSVAIDWLPLSSTLTCDNCLNCNAQIQAANPGDIVYLVANISNQVGNCIEFDGKDDVTFDCQGHNIDGDEVGTDYGIWTNSSNGGSNNTVIRNCNMTEFWINLNLEYNRDSYVYNITTSQTTNSEAALRIDNSNNVTAKNITASSWGHGIHFSGTENSSLTDFSALGGLFAIRIQGLLDSSITNGSLYERSFVMQDTAGNHFENISMSSLAEGIYISTNVDDNNFTLFNISAQTGIRIQATSSEGNRFWNNWINASVHLTVPDGAGENYLNISQTTATNIVGGNYIGGNFWTNSTGDGFSDTCTDVVSPFGICDVEYNLSNGTSTAIDYLPLTTGYTGDCDVFCYNCSNCTTEISAASVGEKVCLASDIFDYNGTTNPDTSIGETCIRFGGQDNITFSCQGYNIDGDGDQYGIGIWMNESNSGSNNNTIQDCNISDFGNGVYSQDSDYNTYINVTAQGNTYRGFQIRDSIYFKIYNSTSIFNDVSGIYLMNGRYGEIKDTNLSFNYQGLTLFAYSENFCEHIVTGNVAGNRSLPLVYYNNTAGITVQDNNSIGQLVFCGVTDSLISNISMDSDDGIYLTIDSDNNTIEDCSLQNIDEAISFTRSDDSTILDCNLSDNQYSIYSYLSDRNYIERTNISFSNTGVYFFNVVNNTITKSIFESNTIGIHLYGDSLYNSLNNSNIFNNTYGVYLQYSDPDYPINNTFYNNLFNNTDNVLSSHAGNTNFWNISKTLGTNIWGGSYIGGNFWTNPSGTGWSDNCTDTDGDGLCNQQYNITANNTDYLPIAKTAVTHCDSCENCTAKISAASDGDMIYLSENITSYAGTSANNHPGESCIRFNGSDNIIFNCQGNTINGDSDNWGYGFWFNQSNGGSENNTIRDCTNISGFGTGIFIEYSQNNLIRNSRSINNGYGVQIDNADNNTLDGMIMTENSDGMRILNSKWNTVANSTMNESNYRDLIVSASAEEDCNNTFTNVNGTANRPVGYYYSQATISDIEFSALAVCNADGIIMDNITVRGSETLDNSQFQILRTEDARFTNINSSDNYLGINMVASENNTFINLTLVGSAYGILIDDTLDSKYSSATISQNTVGIRITGISQYNTFANSTLAGNSNAGVTIDTGSSPVNNTFYNNIFNNTANVQNDDNHSNLWNTSKTLGTNIWGGEYLGGNFWTNPSGTGWSDNCTDTDGDGLCNQQYNITANNTDYMPIAKMEVTHCDSCENCTAKISAASDGDLIYLSENITSYVGTSANNHPGESCIRFNGSDNLIFNCNGYTINGDNDNWGYGIWLNDSNGGSDNNTIRDCDNITGFYHGVFLYFSNNNTLRNLSVYNNTYSGISIQSSSENEILNSSVSQGSYYGLNLFYSINNTITNSTFTDNNNIDVYIGGNSHEYCSHSFNNITVSGGELGYSNSKSLIENKTYGQLILCNANDSVLNNVSIVTPNQQNMLYIMATDNVTLNKINSSGNYYGLYIYLSFNVSVNDSVFDSNQFGVDTRYSDLNIINNSFMRSNSYGVRLESGSEYNILTGSEISGNTVQGVRLGESASLVVNNTFYNNIFNNTDNVYSNNNGNNNTWNISKTAGTNIFGGAYLGGNFWTNPTGTGWSDNCTDTDGDGLCNQQYNITVNNTDYLPIAVSTSSICGIINSDYTLINNVSAIGTCFIVNNTNVTFDCAGHSIIGNDSGIGILTSHEVNVTIKDCVITNFTDGIYLNYTNESLVDNNTVYDVQDDALELSFADNNTVQYNNLTGDGNSQDCSIQMVDSDNNLIMNNTLISQDHGLRMAYGTRSNITGNSIIKTNYDDRGLFMSNINSPARANHSIDTTNTIDGLPIYYYSINNFNPALACPSKVENLSGSYLGLAYCDDIIVNNITLHGENLVLHRLSGVNLSQIRINSSYNGLQLSGANTIILDGFNITNVYGGGTALWESTHSNIYKNGYINGHYGLNFNQADSNTSAENLTIDADTCISFGWDTKTNITMTNSSLTCVDYSVRFNAANGGELIMINTSFNKSKVLILENSNNLTVKYYVRARVIDSTGSGLSGADVNISDNNTKSLLNATTNVNGYTNWIIVTEYFQNISQNYTAGNVTYYTPHNFNASLASYSNSTAAVINYSQTVIISMQTNSGPVINQVNITPTTAYINSTFNCSALPIDNESTDINVSFTWYINGLLNTSWNTTVECTNNTWCYTDSYPSGILKHYNITCSARAFDGSLHSDWANSSEIEVSNAEPYNVSLLLPVHGNDTLLNRRPTFNWTNTTDQDNDTLLFEISILRMDPCGWPLGCSVDNVTENTTDLNFTPSLDLDIDTWYNWSVRVWDGENWSIWAPRWNFSIISTSMIVLDDTINFGSMELNDTDNTTDNIPAPFLIENNGNVKLNISVYTQTPLWDSVTLNTSYFMFQAGNSTETNAFDWSQSITSWTPVSNVLNLTIAYLNYSINDSAEIDIFVEVPPGESEGTKQSVIIMEAEYSG